MSSSRIFTARPIAVVGSAMLAVALITMGGVFSPGAVHAQDKLSKFLLMKLSREQSAVLCKSEAFTQCMAFTGNQCFELAEKALKECMGPLPDTINLAELQNDALEACPKRV